MVRWSRGVLRFGRVARSLAVLVARFCELNLIATIDAEYFFQQPTCLVVCHRANFHGHLPSNHLTMSLPVEYHPDFGWLVVLGLMAL